MWSKAVARFKIGLWHLLQPSRLLVSPAILQALASVPLNMLSWQSSSSRYSHSSLPQFTQVFVHRCIHQRVLFTYLSKFSRPFFLHWHFYYLTFHMVRCLLSYLTHTLKCKLCGRKDIFSFVCSCFPSIWNKSWHILSSNNYLWNECPCGSRILIDSMALVPKELAANLANKYQE